MLTEADKQLYARQILLPELGVAGQERLCAASVAFAAQADPRCRAVAEDYLLRAGVRVTEVVAASRVPDAAATARLVELAGDPGLEETAGWLLGAWTAVEAIKSIAGLTGAAGAASLDPAFVLAVEKS